jgi:hypothetical protein
MPCYTTTTTLYANNLDDGEATYYYISFASQSTVRVIFLPPAGESITSVSCSPSGPTTGNYYVEFGTSHVGGTYTVTVVYTGSQRDAPLVTPTKTPKFKPVVSCP